MWKDREHQLATGRSPAHGEGSTVGFACRPSTSRSNSDVRPEDAQIKSYAQTKVLGGEALEARLYLDNADTQCGVAREAGLCVRPP